MKSKALDQTAKFLEEKWDKSFATEVMADAKKRLEELCLENEGECKAKKVHLTGDIFPCMSVYESLQKHGIAKEEALEFMDRTWSKKAEAGAASTGKMLKLFGLYHLYPMMFQSVAKKQFGKAAGFEAKFYDCGKSRCKFDMTRCLFFDTCQRYGCPELTKCFCHVDDVNNENLHPRLKWNRSKFMGGGGDLCDFDIYVIPKK